jgi:putative hydrolase of the HAD superfamily
VTLSVDRSDVDAVLFDMGGIFFLPDPGRVRVALAASGHDAPRDDAPFHRAHFVAVHAYDHSADAPETWDAYLVAYLVALGVDQDRVHEIAPAVEPIWLDPASDHWIWVQPDAVSMLQTIGRRLPVAIVSNSDGSAEACLRDGAICQVGPGPGVEVPIVVDSHLVGIRKPDPAIFEPALAAVGVAPGRALYVGDTVKNDVDGARAAGLHPVHYDPYDLYPGAAHDRVRSLLAVADHLAA